MTIERPMFPPRAEPVPSTLQIGRRGLLCGLAAVPALAALPAPLYPPASAASAMAAPDPILAAIEAHVFAVLEFEQAFDGTDAEINEASAEADQAAWAMLQVEPTSIEGVWALLIYFAQCSDDDEQLFPEGKDGEIIFSAALARHAAKALSRIISEGVR